MSSFFNVEDSTSARIAKVVSVIALLAFASANFWHMYEYQIWFFDMTSGYVGILFFGAILYSWSYDQESNWYNYRSQITAVFLIVFSVAFYLDMHAKINTKNYNSHVIQMKMLKINNKNQERELLNKVEAEQ